MEQKKLLEEINRKTIKNTLLETLDIKFTSIGDKTLTAQMPVNSKVHQPMGLLHGGATAALAETVGSTASYVFLNRDDIDVRGIELSINHLRSKREGTIFATAKPIHLGKTTHLWEIVIKDENDQLIAHSKLTNIVLQKKK